MCFTLFECIASHNNSETLRPSSFIHRSSAPHNDGCDKLKVLQVDP